MLFHSELGTIGDKAEMIRQLGEWFAARLPGVDATMVRQASKLAKADLVTGMVGEFPELQGVMGCYYAKQQGVADEVAIAIRDHYLPQGPTDRCPTSPTSVVVALADKIDTLAGLFLIGERPTGSKDPFGLRRAALGVIRIILENKLRLPLGELIEDAIRSRANVLSNQIDRVAVADELKTFFADRLKVHLRDAGVRHDLISAVFATGDDDLVRLLARVDALDKFLATDDGANLLIAYRRATNILRIEERKDNKVYREKPDYDKLGVEELDLNFALMAAENNTKPLMANYRFKATMEELAKLRSPIDSFFEKVTVNAPNSEVREHRLRLLNRVRAAIDEIADFSLIEDVVSENHNRRVA
jgi:glycyl-tRNA synthetase beta chain